MVHSCAPGSLVSRKAGLVPKTTEFASLNVKRAFPSWHVGTAHPGPHVTLTWAESWPLQPFAFLYFFSTQLSVPLNPVSWRVCLLGCGKCLSQGGLTQGKLLCQSSGSRCWKGWVLPGALMEHALQALLLRLAPLSLQCGHCCHTLSPSLLRTLIVAFGACPNSSMTSP